MAATLTTAEQALFDEYQNVVGYCLRRRWRRWRNYDGDDLYQVGLQALAEGIIALRAKPQKFEHIGGFLRKCVASAVWKYKVENGRAVRIPARAACEAKRGEGLGEALREFVLNGGRSLTWPDAPAVKFGKHSGQWLKRREAAHRALVLAVHRLTGLERQLACTLLSERLCVSEPSYRARLVDLAKRTGVSRRALSNLELRVLKSAVVIAKGRPHGRRTTTAGREARAYKAIRRAGPQADRVVLAIVGAMDGRAALAAATIAAGRLLAPPDARLSLADLAGCLQMTRGEVRRLEVELLDQAVRLLSIRGVAA